MNSAISVEESKRPCAKHLQPGNDGLGPSPQCGGRADPACIHRLTNDRSVKPTCDVDDESIESFGGPSSMFRCAAGSRAGRSGSQNILRRTVR